MAENGVQLEERNEQDAVEGKTERAGARAREQRAGARPRDKVEEAHLPTPPPDPWAPSTSSVQDRSQRELKRPRSLEEEEDIIAYLTDIGASPFEGQTSECPSRNSTASTMAVAGLCSGEAFEHLDRLYSLTEQILELRSRSSKLFRRVRDLERLKVLRNADRRLENAFARNKELETNYCEEDTGFAESLLDAMLSNCRDPQPQRRNLRSPYSRQRSRSLALSEQSLPRLPSPAARSEAEKGVRNNGSCNAPKVSKWTRVKAAFKWERACANDSVDTTDASVTTPTTPTTKYLRIPEAGSGNWSGSTLSPSTSEVSGPSTPLGRVSSASSSNEGSCDGARKNSPNQLDRQSLKASTEKKGEGASRRSRSLDGDMVATSATGESAAHASEIGPGKPLIRITSDSNPMIRSTSIPEKGRSAIMTKRTAPPTLTITIPNNDEEIRSVSSPESMSPLPVSAQNSGRNSPQCPRPGRQETSREFKRQRSTMEETSGGNAKMQRHDSKWNKVRRAFLTNTAFSVPPSPIRVVSGQAFAQDGAGTPKAHSCSGSVEDLEKSALTNSQAETRRDYQALREKLGAEFHRKLVEWERLKNASPRNTARNARESISLVGGGGSALSGREALLPAEERLAPEFKKKLQDWKRAKKGRRGSATLEQQRVHRRRLTDWQLWRSPSKPDTRSQDTLASNPIGDHGKHHFCEDFVRRMEVWRRMNESGTRGTDAGRGRISQKLMTSSTIDESEFLPLEKVFSGVSDRVDRDRRDSNVRQLEECFDGETRLTDTGQNASCNNEILIRTSVGSYRFEGISREFTRKLYDWEKYRGISPRSSTFRLLGPGYAPFAGESDTENRATTETSIKVTDDEKVLGVLKKSKSEGNVMKASSRKDNFARRSCSLQYLDRLANKLDDSDRTNASPAPNDSRARVDVSDDTIMDDSEPEAMIVDIEDVIEETASPLERVQPHQTPVYSVAASETTSIAVPLGTVTSSHEPSPVFFVEVENSTNRKHWESRSWNQRKTFSSDDSPSPEHFRERKFRNRNNSSGDGETSTKDFDGYEPIEWCPADKDSLKSDNSTGTYDSCQERIVDVGQQEDFRDLHRNGIPAVPSDGEGSKDQDIKIPESRVSEKDAKGDWSVSVTAVLPAPVQDTRKLMDLSSGKTVESELYHEDGQQDQDGSCDADEVTPVSERKFKYGNLQEITSDSSLESPQPIQDHEVPLKYPQSSLTPLERSEIRRVDIQNHKVLQHDIKILQYAQLSDMRSEIRKSDTNYNSSNDKSSTKTINSHVTHVTQSKNEIQYHKHEKPSASISHSIQSSNFDYKRGPTIRTTPLTITSSREERNFERIFINEKTLNKIVVPTVSRNDTTNRRSQSTESSDSKSTVEDSDSNRENSRSRETNGKKTDSPTRNVLIKTKRMIFSPFRREDKNKKESDTSEDERTLRGQSASKSRSTSPKISRHDAILRMPLSLPWPLRPSSKDREVRQDQKLEEFARTRQTLRGTLFEKKDSRRSTITEIQRRVALRNNVRLIEASDEAIKSQAQREQQVDASVQVTAMPDSRRTWTPVAQSVARSRPRDNQRETSLISEALSSDLIHKLNILSSVAARHDARTNSISIDQAIESHSSRVRRAKESFLSRRGGPLCRSLFDTRPSNPDITKTTRDPYKCTPSNSDQDEHRNGDDQSDSSDEEVRTLICEEAIIKEQEVNQDEKLINNSGSDLSNCSRPDLVKSASAGMINVDPDTFDRLTEQARGCESLPRTIIKPREPSGALAKIVSKFKFSKLIRGREADDSMSTISRLCRQSLLIDIRSGFEERRESEDLSDGELKGKDTLRRNDPKK